MGTAWDLASPDRVAVIMWIEAVYEGGCYVHHSANLSADGIHFPNTIPPPAGTRLQLEFTLPGDGRSTCAHGEVVARREPGMHVRFFDLEEPVREHLREFVARARRRAGEEETREFTVARARP
jgi:hypothetical protein